MNKRSMPQFNKNNINFTTNKQFIHMKRVKLKKVSINSNQANIRGAIVFRELEQRD